ncbi:MAG: hypothetical protein AAGG56_06140 [Pseudomonadota bacterium]
MLALAALLSAPAPARAQPLGLCETLEAVTELHEAIQRTRPNLPRTWPENGRLAARLEGLDPEALSVISGYDPDGSIDTFIGTLRRFARLRENYGGAAGFILHEAQDLPHLAQTLKKISAGHGCVDNRERSVPVQSKEREHNSDGKKTFLGSRRNENAYDYGHILSKAALVVPPVFLLAGLVVTLGIYRSRRFHRLWDQRHCNVVVKVGEDQDAREGLMLDACPMWAKVLLRNPPEPGTVMHMEWGDHAHSATVMWSNKHCAGVRFDAQLSDEALQEISALTDKHIAELEDAQKHDASDDLAGTPPGGPARQPAS